MLNPDDCTALLEAEKETVAAANSRDASRLAGLYVEDAIVILGGSPALAGQAAIREWIDRLAQNREVTFRHQNIDARVSAGGDMGFTASRYEVSIVRPDSSRFEGSGHWAQIWRKDGAGGWKLVLEISTT